MRLVKFISTELPNVAQRKLRPLGLFRNIDKLTINGFDNHGYVFYYTKNRLRIIKYYDSKMIYAHECCSEHYALQECNLYNKLQIHRWLQQIITNTFDLYYTNKNHISFIRDKNAAVAICDTITMHYNFNRMGYQLIKFNCSYVGGISTVHRAIIYSYLKPVIIINL